MYKIYLLREDSPLSMGVYFNNYYLGIDTDSEEDGENWKIIGWEVEHSPNFEGRGDVKLCMKYIW